MSSIDHALFRTTLLEEFRSAWLYLRAARPRETFYAFGLYTTELAGYLTVTASTEQGLLVATAEDVARCGTDPVLARAALRWSPCDSPLHKDGVELLAKSDALRRDGPDPHDETKESDEAIAFVFETAIDVLNTLDRDNLFGIGLVRARLVLGIWMGDQSDEERVEFARRLNSKSIVRRFAKELDDGIKALNERARRA